MNVLITGGTGLIGTALTAFLKDKNVNVAVLSRSKSDAQNRFLWDPEKEEIEIAALKWADHIIHLAGAGIVEKKWTNARKKVLIDSRVQTANLIFKSLAENNIAIDSFISASGTGFYGNNTSDTIYTENHPSAHQFISEICVVWEAAAQQFQTIGIPYTILRTSVVLTSKGGALEKISMPIKYGFGSALGSGKQYVPWIHINDLCTMYYAALTNATMHNQIYNAVAPESITNQVFTEKIAQVLNKKLLLPNVPKFVLQLLLGERAAIILEGSPISSDKIQQTGFKFQFRNVKEALQDCLSVKARN